MDKLILNQDEINIIEKDSNIHVELNNDQKEYNILIKEHVTCNMNIVAKNNQTNYNFDLQESSIININFLNIDDSSKININLNGINSKINLNYSAINYDEQNYIINVNHNTSNTKSSIINHGVSVLGNKMVFNVNGTVYSQAEECVCNQNNKIINIRDSKSVIMPNLYINNYNVEANHSAFIGEFDKKQLFYLTSRGIKKEDALFLLLKSFLINKMELDEDIISNYIEEIQKIKEI